MKARVTGTGRARGLLVILLGLLTAAYPFGIWWSLGHLDPWAPALLLAAFAIMRAALGQQPLWWIVAALAVLLSLAGGMTADWLPLKLYPVAVNCALLAVFCLSLYRGPPVIERLARISEPQLTPAGVAYTRRVTQVWAAFFALNGGISLVTALWASDVVWTLYNGAIAYVLIGALFAGEYLVRRRLRRSFARTDAPDV
jgi:uncharacterized membrane protein